jgi:glycosyltransferase involved in cell wall biosynthesis
MRVGIDCRKIADFGIGTYGRGLLRGLAELDGDYVAFVPSHARELVPRASESIAVDVPNYSVREQLVMRRAIDRARLDVFHSAHYVLPWTSCPSIATVHDVILFHFPPPNPLARLYLNVMHARACRRSVRVITVSEASKRAIVETLHCDATKIAVTPNGIDEMFVAEGPAEEGRYFLYVGNDKPHKNVPRLIEAVSQLRNVKLMMVGAPFAQYRDVPNVHALGFVTNEKLTALYRGAIALVMPSLEEGFGLPVAEAMACGTPVIASDIASLVEVTGGAALLVDPHSSQSIAAAMQRLLDDERMREELSNRGRAQAAQFTWRRCAERTRDVYRAVL